MNPETPSQRTETSARGLALLAVACAAVFLAGIYMIAAYRLPGGIALSATPPNAFFDMDTARVIHDWTSWDAPGRVRVHPLYKYISLLGMPAAALAGDAQEGARLLSIAFLLVQAALCGWLVFLLRRTVSPALLAALIAGVSAPALLLAAVPDSASASGIFSIAPFVLLYARRGKPLPHWEAACWAGLAIGCFGVTISQLSFYFVALGFRIAWQMKSDARPAAFAGSAVARVLIPSAAVVWILLEVQLRLFHADDKPYKLNRIIASEMKFFESEELAARPFGRFLELAAQIAIADFASPDPRIVRWSPPRNPERVFYSISVRGARLGDWSGTRALALGLTIGLIAAALALFDWRGRWRDILPIAIALAGQVCLHFVYGREFVMYAANWHPLLIAMLIAGQPRTTFARPTVVAALLLYTALMAGNNLSAIDRAFELYRTDYPVEEAFRLVVE